MYSDDPMKLQQLRCLIALADSGSMRAAASALAISPAAMSQTLRELEEACGAPLFRRTVTGTVTTDAGSRLLAHARLIAGQVRRAEQEIDAIRDVTTATLGVAITPWVSQALLPQTIGLWQKRFPKARIDAYESLGSGYHTLRDGTVDLAIGLPPREESKSVLFHRPLCTCGFAVIARRGHPQSKCTSLRDLANARWVLTLRQDGSVQPLNQLLHRWGIQPRPDQILIARSTLIALSMLEGSDAITVCPWPLVESPLLRQRVQALPIRDPLPPMACSLITRRGEPLSAVAQGFVDCFLESLQRGVRSKESALRKMLDTVTTDVVSDAPMGERSETA